MAPTIKTLAQIRDDQLRDIQNELPDADVGSDSDYYVRASSVGSVIEGLYSYKQWQTKQIFITSADDDMLLRHASVYQMSLKGAVEAQGTAALVGTPGLAVAAGLKISRGALTYTTTTGTTLGADGTGMVSATADATGSDSNITEATIVQLTTPPAGVQSQATLLTMQGGLEVETYDQLRSRLLDRIRNPPGGGKVSDYKGWALEVPGITNAYVYPHRIAVGRVDVAVISGTGLPSQDEIDAVQLNIDLKRPAACRGVTVFVPELKVIDHVVQVDWSGSDLAVLKATLEPQFQSYYAGLNPGDSAVRSKLGSLVSDAAGVSDYLMVSPDRNITAEVSNVRVQWVRYGSLELQRMPT
ncbi:baseplate J/gp47 family protein [Burkholderia gladioli]|uniref:baseplate J/gp47 family protein n=1 Tax=Burkholderia gladioli TaxID=28095 RepID=UPI001C607357|nr:baseplate J/gp47 family protein [Burkholderia gladioli]MBW5285783.1 baseplate J/gp47 family protein [Burkholderia gladioli]